MAAIGTSGWISVKFLLFALRVGCALDLFFSNETCILSLKSGANVTAAICQENGNIVGLDADLKAGFLFWSNNAEQYKGLYRADTNGSRLLKIVNDTLLVNGLVLDRISRLIYWTDAGLHYVQSCHYDGSDMRIILFQDLSDPRGLVVDHLNGLLIWNDQGRHTIEMSRLDGSQRRNITNTDAQLPNQMVMVRQDNMTSKLYYVDAGDQSIKYILLTNISLGPHAIEVHTATLEVSLKAESQVLFGLTADDDNDDIIYVTTWGECNLLKINTTDKSTQKLFTGLGKKVLFSISSPIELNNATGENSTCVWPVKSNCSHICIHMGPTNDFRCACPTYGGLMLDNEGRSCSVPSDVLVYADMFYGHVGWTNIPLNLSNNEDSPQRTLHLIGRSSSAVAVAYDPLEKVIYWSDPEKRSIFARPFNASSPTRTFLGPSDFVDTVDGLAVDHVRRNLYFSSTDDATVDGVLYLRHSIEVVSLDERDTMGRRRKRRRIVWDAERPRGLWVDHENKYLYYTDWGSSAKVVRSNLDGTNPEVILSRQVEGIENPNSVLRSRAGEIFVIDSMFNHRDQSNVTLPSVLWHTSREISASLPNQTASYNWTKTTMQDIKMPFGLATLPSAVTHVFISDWESRCVWGVDTASMHTTRFLDSSTAKKPSGILSFQSNATVSEGPACNASYPCSLDTNGGICLDSGSESRCYCPSRGFKIMTNGSCSVPENFIIIADMMAIRMVGLNSGGDKALYDLVSGDGTVSFSALTYSPLSRVVFYSNVNGGMIMSMALDDRLESRLFYNASQVVDDMLIHDGFLYWIANVKGQVSRLKLTSDLLNWSAPHEVIASGLQDPKSLALYEKERKIYWTSDTSPNVWMLDLNSNNYSTVVQSNVSSAFRSGSLSIDQTRGLMYLLNRQDGRLIVCNISRLGDINNCQDDGNLTGAGNFYGLSVLSNTIYYSSWGDRSVYSYDLTTKEKQIIAQNLIRPTRFYLTQPTIIVDGNNCTNASCPEVCVQQVHGYTCACRSASDVMLSNGSCIPGETLPANLPPYFINCPKDIHVFTTNSQESVWWKSPTTSGISRKQVKKNLTVTVQPGSLLSPGTHLVHYVMYNHLQLKAECKFNIILTQILGASCTNSYSAINGDVQCNLTSKPANCTIKCREGFSLLPGMTPGRNFQSCNANDSTNTFFCARSSHKVPTSNLKIIFAERCPSDNDSFMVDLFFAFYSRGLCGRPDANYEGSADLCNPENFKGINCNNSTAVGKRSKRQTDSRFSAEMDLWRTDDTRNRTSQLAILIQQRKFYVDSLEKDYSPFLAGKTLYPVDMTETDSNSTCPSDTYPTVNDTCITCPYGTMFVAQNQTCQTCPENTYQPNEGQRSCLQCPSGSHSPAGAYEVDQCKTQNATEPTGHPSSSGPNVPLIVGLVVGLTLGILLIIIIILLVCWCLKKKEDGAFSLVTRRGMGEDNGYYGDDTVEDHPVPLNYYGTSHSNEVAFKGVDNPNFQPTNRV